tara:strand:+ start:99 stop:557 length:459 start_codon:yes stop_codon:yes gene_type:complete
MFKLGPLVYFLILFSSVPSKDIIIDYSDVVEVNYVYRYDDTAEKYNKRMCQIIWWEFRNIFQQDKDGNYRHLPQYVVKDFRVVWSETSSPKKVGSIMPIRRGKDWVCLFYDKNDNRVREVVSYSKTESHTQHDPEVDNRQVLPLNLRNKLAK